MLDPTVLGYFKDMDDPCRLDHFYTEGDGVTADNWTN